MQATSRLGATASLQDTAVQANVCFQHRRSRIISFSKAARLQNGQAMKSGLVMLLSMSTCLSDDLWPRMTRPSVPFIVP